MILKYKKLDRADKVAAWRLCVGCGACVYTCPNEAISLVDIVDVGIRPQVDESKCQQCQDCVRVCPGIGLEHEPFNSETIPKLLDSWGPVLEIWEGYATDAEIRFKASSGGAATALALFCLEKENFSGVLHIGASHEAPLQNVPAFSRDRGDLLACTGSRYSPAAPCEKLNWTEESDSPCVFIGKPCDVAALRKSQAINPTLNKNVGLAISIFCAGTPSSNGTKQILDNMEVNTNQVSSIKYRGNGWPGMATVKVKGRSTKYEITYAQAWGDILSKHVPLRCRLCPDGTGEFGDISCGDPWYRKVEPNEPGRSLVLVRTERGREVLQKAIQADYIRIEQVEPDVLPRSQSSLLKRKSHLWGRLLAMRAMRIPVPHFEGFSLFYNWRDLSAGEKIRSIAGTLKRILQRKWYRPLKAFKKE